MLESTVTIRYLGTTITTTTSTPSAINAIHAAVYIVAYSHIVFHIPSPLQVPSH
jgi:hypothetical protein